VSVAAPAPGAGWVAVGLEDSERRVETAERLQSERSTEVSKPSRGGTLVAMLAGIQLGWFAFLAYVLVRLGV
jgi:hypothetical protein